MLPSYVCPIDSHMLLQTENSLRCTAGHSFPVIDGIPRFVESKNYADAFGLQWKRHRLTQLDSVSGLRISHERARRCLGSDVWDSLKDLQILECGCGAGRFTEVLLSREALVTSIDLSVAVEANADNFPINDRHQVAQANIFELPFKPSSFDVVFCLGVIQHLPNPDLGIEKLFRMVKPGGLLVIDHYRWSLAWYTRTAPLFRMILKNMPAEKTMRLTQRLVDFFFPLHRLARKSRPLQMLLSRFSPLVTYFHAFPHLPLDQQREWALLDTHDSLTDYFKHFKTQRNLTDRLENLGAERIEVWKGGNGLEARALKKSSPDSRRKECSLEISSSL